MVITITIVTILILAVSALSYIVIDQLQQQHKSPWGYAMITFVVVHLVGRFALSLPIHLPLLTILILLGLTAYCATRIASNASNLTLLTGFYLSAFLLSHY